LVRDITSLAGAVAQALKACEALRGRGSMDDHELPRVVYRFAGETVDVKGFTGNKEDPKSHKTLGI
jgi:hypothetical protein